MGCRLGFTNVQKVCSLAVLSLAEYEYQQAYTALRICHTKWPARPTYCLLMALLLRGSLLH